MQLLTEYSPNRQAWKSIFSSVVAGAYERRLHKRQKLIVCSAENGFALIDKRFWRSLTLKVSALY